MKSRCIMALSVVSLVRGIGSRICPFVFSGSGGTGPGGRVGDGFVGGAALNPAAPHRAIDARPMRQEMRPGRSRGFGWRRARDSGEFGRASKHRRDAGRAPWQRVRKNRAIFRSGSAMGSLVGQIARPKGGSIRLTQSRGRASFAERSSPERFESGDEGGEEAGASVVSRDVV